MSDTCPITAHLLERYIRQECRDHGVLLEHLIVDDWQVGMTLNGNRYQMTDWRSETWLTVILQMVHDTLLYAKDYPALLTIRAIDHATVALERFNGALAGIKAE